MKKNRKEIIQPDRDGNIILKSPASRQVSTLILIISSGILFFGSIYFFIRHGFTVINTIRSLCSALILFFSVTSLRNRPVYIITNEKILLLNTWEILFSDIDSISLNKFKFIKTLVIKSKNVEFTIDQSSVEIPLEQIAKYLTHKLKQ